MFSTGGPLAASSQDAALAYAVIAENKVGSFYNQLYDGSVRGPPAPHLDRCVFFLFVSFSLIHPPVKVFVNLNVAITSQTIILSLK